MEKPVSAREGAAELGTESIPSSCSKLARAVESGMFECLLWWNFVLVGDAGCDLDLAS